MRRVSGHFVAPDFETKSVIFLDLFIRLFNAQPDQLPEDL